MTSPRLVTHKDCMDGSMSALVFRSVFPDADIIFVNPHEVDSVEREDGVRYFFVDVCPSVCMSNDVVLDHHVSSREKLKTIEGHAELDSSRCGCMLLHDFLLKSDEIQEESKSRLRRFTNMCGVVDDYDRYLLKRPVSEHLARVHQFVGQDAFITKISCECESQSYLGHVNDFGVIPPSWREISNILKNNEQRYVERLIDFSWCGHAEYAGTSVAVAFVYAEEHTNAMADEMLRVHGDAKFAAIINLKMGKISIRSRSDEYDCSLLARESSPFGGGHKRSAGLPIDSLLRSDIRSVIG